MDENVCCGAMDVAVIKAIGDVLIASINNGLVVRRRDDPGTDVGESLGRGYAAFMREAAKASEDDEGDDVKEADAVRSKLPPSVCTAPGAAAILNEFECFGSRDWRFNMTGQPGEDTVYNEAFGCVLKKDGAVRIANHLLASQAAATKGGV